MTARAVAEVAALELMDCGVPTLAIHFSLQAPPVFLPYSLAVNKVYSACKPLSASESDKMMF